MAIIPSPFCAKCPCRAVAAWSHPAIPAENIAGWDLSLCARHDADWAPRYVGTRWTRTSLTADRTKADCAPPKFDNLKRFGGFPKIDAPRTGRTCTKHGTEQYVPAGEACPYCEPEPATKFTREEVCRAFGVPPHKVRSLAPVAKLHTREALLPADVAEKLKCDSGENSVVRLSSCGDGEGYLVPPNIAEQLKRRFASAFERETLDGSAPGGAKPVGFLHLDAPPTAEAIEKLRLSWDHALLEPGDTYAGRLVRSVEDDEDGITVELEPPNPVSRWPLLVARAIDSAAVERIKRSWNEKYGPNPVSFRPQGLLLDEPSPEERAAWAVCEFLRWGATPTRPTYGESPVARAMRAAGLAEMAERFAARYGPFPRTATVTKCRCGTYQYVSPDTGWFDDSGRYHTAERCP